MPRRDRAGFTVLEAVIATFVALVVVFALGRLILVNERSWEWGRDKTVLQQNTTEALEWMARSIRVARRIVVASDSEFSTFNEHGVLVHTYERAIVGSAGRLYEDGADLVDRNCTRFRIVPDEDTTSVTLDLELEDNAGNRVAATTRATLRNRTFEF